EIARRVASAPGEPRGDREAQPRGIRCRRRDEPIRRRPRALLARDARDDSRADARCRGGRRRAHRGDLLLPAPARGRLHVPQAEAGSFASSRDRLRSAALRRAVRRGQAVGRRGGARRGRASDLRRHAARRNRARAARRARRRDAARSFERGRRAAREVMEAPTMRQWIGSVLFTLFLFLSVPLYAPIVVLTGFLPRRVTYRCVLLWIDAQLFMLERLCGIRHEVEGVEHLPKEPSIVLMKHSSTWETLAQLRLLPRQTWVLKRELMWAPFFGWALALLKPIAIDRRGGRVAVEQVISQGRERLAEGLWVVIFPEGTRVPFGQTGRFGLSGALLAQACGKPVIP